MRITIARVEELNYKSLFSFVLNLMTSTAAAQTTQSGHWALVVTRWVAGL